MNDATRRNAISGNKISATTEARHGKQHVYVMTPLATAVIAALSPTEAVVAQEDDGPRIEEIIVTATKREMSLQDVPHSIDVLSTVELERIGAKSLEDVIKALPSVAINSTVPGRNSLVIRGVSSGAFEYRTDAQVAVYLDEQPLTTNSQQVGFRAIDMARVESLAGPQGTLFGSSSQTGTIRYITNKPNHQGVAGRVEARYGTTKGGADSYELNGHINLPVAEDKFAVRAVGYTSLDGGYVDNVLGSSLSGNFDNADVVEDDFNEYEADGGRIAALWNMGDKWSLLASLVTERTHSEGTWDTDPYLGDHKITRFVKEFRDDDWYSAGLTLNGDLGFAELSVSATHLDRDIAYLWDNNTYAHFKDRWWGGGLYYELYYAGNPDYAYYPNYPLYDSDYIHSSIFNEQEQQRDAIELRLTSSGESKLQWTAGAYYEDVYDEWYYGSSQPGIEDTRMWGYANYLAYYYGVANYYNNYTPNTNITYPLVVTDVSYSNTLRRSVKQKALFAEVSYDLTDDLTVLGGVRWAEYDRDTFSRFSFPEGMPAGDRGTTDGSFSSSGKTDDTIYKVSLSYTIDDQRMVYALFSQGFRLGGINSPRAAATGAVPVEYLPDYLDNYEVGIKSQWLNNRLTVNADFFLMEWRDYQEGASFGQWWLRGTVNANSSETKGFDVQADWQATERLFLSANLFMADPEFTSDWANDFEGGLIQPPGDEGSLDIKKGMPMPNSPERKYFISAYYEIPDVLGGDFWVYLDHSYESEKWNTSSNIVNDNRFGIAPSWTYSSLKFGLMLQNGLEFDVHVRNLFDEKGYGYVSTGSNNDADLFNDPREHNLRALSQPRTVWFSVRKNFGGG